MQIPVSCPEVAVRPLVKYAHPHTFWAGKDGGIGRVGGLGGTDGGCCGGVIGGGVIGGTDGGFEGTSVPMVAAAIRNVRDVRSIALDKCSRRSEVLRCKKCDTVSTAFRRGSVRNGIHLIDDIASRDPMQRALQRTPLAMPGWAGRARARLQVPRCGARWKSARPQLRRSARIRVLLARPCTGTAT